MEHKTSLNRWISGISVTKRCTVTGYSFVELPCEFRMIKETGDSVYAQDNPKSSCVVYFMILAWYINQSHTHSEVLTPFSSRHRSQIHAQTVLYRSKFIL